MPPRSSRDIDPQPSLFPLERPAWHLDSTTRAVGLAGVRRARATLLAARANPDASSIDAQPPIAERVKSLEERWVNIAGSTHNLASGIYDSALAESAVERLHTLMDDYDPGFVARFEGQRTRTGHVRERDGRRLQMVELALADVAEVKQDITAVWRWIEQPLARGVPFEQHLLETPGYFPFRHELLYVYRHTLLQGQLEVA